MTSGFDSRIHCARRITSNGFGTLVLMPSVRTRTPTCCIRSARSRMAVSETTSFSNRVPSIPEAIRQSIVSAPAGPRVVMMCMTFIMLVFRFPCGQPDRSLTLDFHTLFGRNGGLAEVAFCFQMARVMKDTVVQFFVCPDHRRDIVALSCPSGCCQSEALPGFLISQERYHSAGETLNISERYDKTLLSTLDEVRHAPRSCAHDRQTRGHCFHHRKRSALPVRAQHKNIHCAQHIRNLGTKPEAVDLACQAKALCYIFQLC